MQTRKLGWGNVLLLGALVMLCVAFASASAVGQSLDIVFVLDASGSIDSTELDLEIGGIKAGIVAILLPAIPPATINVGVVCFGTVSHVLLPLTPLTTGSWPTIGAAVDKAVTCDRGTTNMIDGLKDAIALLSSSTAARQVINLVSNGLWNQGGDPQPIADAFKQDTGQEIWTLGVGIDANGEAALMAMAGPPPAIYFAASSFDDFKRAEKDKLGNIFPLDGAKSFEELLEKQVALLKSFEELAKTAWAKLTPAQQVEVVASFEDNLKLLADLLLSFEDVLHLKWPHLPPDEYIEYLRSFEDLLKGQAELLKSFEDLLKATLAPTPVRFYE